MQKKIRSLLREQQNCGLNNYDYFFLETRKEDYSSSLPLYSATSFCCTSPGTSS